MWRLFRIGEHLDVVRAQDLGVLRQVGLVVDQHPVVAGIGVPLDLLQAQRDPGKAKRVGRVVRSPAGSPVESVHDQDCGRRQRGHAAHRLAGACSSERLREEWLALLQRSRIRGLLHAGHVGLRAALHLRAFAGTAGAFAAVRAPGARVATRIGVAANLAARIDPGGLCDATVARSHPPHDQERGRQRRARPRRCREGIAGGPMEGSCSSNAVGIEARTFNARRCRRQRGCRVTFRESRSTSRCRRAAWHRSDT